LFHHIRQTDCKEDIIAVYGLDADLIMLSIFHQQFSKNIYVFREAPTFRTVLSCEYEKKELLFMDIDKLSNSIFQEMGKYNLHEKSVRVSDYIFMCFLLGNDFLPHFPALNIRIHGIQILMDTYYQTIGKYRERSFIHATTKKIDWTNVSLFLTELSKNEHTYLLKEYDMRKKWDKYHWGSTTPLEIENLFMNLPVIYRADEKYICPQEKGWECRYYKRLLHTSSSSPDIKDICINYLEGLEWVYSYYTGECPDWKWKYNWSYPPLLSDLIKYIPKKIQYTNTPIDQTPLDSMIQLAYVLPFHQLHLLPSHLREILIHQYSHLYPTEYSFKWAFCRYFWEAHPVLPEIPLSLLKEIGGN
jgi:5'-3' exonuclease